MYVCMYINREMHSTPRPSTPTWVTPFRCHAMPRNGPACVVRSCRPRVDPGHAAGSKGYPPEGGIGRRDAMREPGCNLQWLLRMSMAPHRKGGFNISRI